MLGEGREVVHKSKLIKKKNCIPLNVNQRNIFHFQHVLMGLSIHAILSSIGEKTEEQRGNSMRDMGPVAYGLIFGLFTWKII